MQERSCKLGTCHFGLSEETIHTYLNAAKANTFSIAMSEGISINILILDLPCESVTKALITRATGILAANDGVYFLLVIRELEY